MKKNLVMRSKEYTSPDEYRVMHGGVESVHCTPETNINITEVILKK